MSLISKIANLFSPTAQKTGGAENKMCVTSKDMRDRARQMAAEGIVLLKNDGTLPIKESDEVAVFGRTQYDWFCVGYGSGGDVNAPYKISFADGLKNAGGIKINKKLDAVYAQWCKQNVPDEGYWGHWPYSFKEMPVSENLVWEASETSNVAIVTIGRSAGEDREQKLKDGSFYLTVDELNLIDKVTAIFEKTVLVLDVGNVIDFEEITAFGDRINAIVLAWQGGMESGNALCDVLSGKVNPSGRLTDTIARNYDLYPSSHQFGYKDFNEYQEDVFVGYRYFETFAKEEVLYPFGFGLSYTTFDVSASVEKTDCGVRILAKVTNTGDRKGKTVVQAYVKKAEGVLVKPARELVAFAKTDEIESGQSLTLSFDVSEYALSSYDDDGATGYKGCWMLEYGDYEFFVGENVRDAQSAGCVSFDKKATSVCHTACSLQKDTSVLSRYNGVQSSTHSMPDFTGNETYFQLKQKLDRMSDEQVERFMHELQYTIDNYGWKYRVAKGGTEYLKERIESNMPSEIAKSDKALNFADVLDGKATLDEFVATLSDEELETLCHGDYRMNSPKGAHGNAGVFGGISESLKEKGVPTATTTDGPSGIRLWAKSSLLPCGSAIASSWNEQLAEKLYECVGDEMLERGSDVLLGPGMNVHRNVLCGRNFEYFSEDPYLSGKTASAIVKGIQSRGVSACVKHFACNNQERFRFVNDSRVSERALREIYLKGFEICVKESNPLCVMTSYNKINGVYSYHNYDLCTTILRGEWGYKNMVMTDWWTKKAKNPLFKGVDDNAYRVRAQVDVLMPGGTRISGKYDGSTLKSLKKGGLKRAELQRTAKNVLGVLAKLEKGKAEYEEKKWAAMPEILAKPSLPTDDKQD